MTLALAPAPDETKAAVARRLLRLGYGDGEIAEALDTSRQYIRLLRQRTVSGETHPRNVARRLRRQERFLQALRQSNGLIRTASKMLGINETTPYVWMQSDPEFAAAVEEIRETAIDHVESKLLDRIDNDDTSAIIFFLKTRAKHRGYTEALSLVGDGGGPVLVKVIEPYIDPLTEVPERQLPATAEENTVDAEFTVIEPQGSQT